ncbi:hypothetical protein UCRPC4_g04160 [Phaeomoniella chlamydospora]|uniref:Rhodopsin domain-containing protein n=1 Tax=Phaeomoniella chlamydospora TaxID=158046 RepID=A0A0G2GAM2_PHACM|nr:hypothetical protein UCRPC4_g04160 [Phaeomoniella chlamydospora]
MHKFWQINPNPGNLCQPTKSKVYVLVTVVLNIITDIYLLSIPLPLLWKVNISLRKKLTLMLLFSGAAFVIMASLIRAVVILTAGPNGAVSGSRWACRETFVSIVVSNLPIIQPLIRKAADKIGLSAMFSSSGRPSQSHPLGSKDAHSGFELRRKAAHPLSLTSKAKGTGTAWGSDEHILGEGQNGQPMTSKDIAVVQEISIQSEAGDTNNAGYQAGAQRDWAFGGGHTSQARKS